MSGTVFGSTTFCVVTGASQGIGRTLAIHLAAKFGSNSVLVLTARNGKGLDETKAEIAAKAPSVEVRCVVGDLAQQSQLKYVCEECMKNVDPTRFNHAMIVQNASSMGDLFYIRDLTNNEKTQELMLLNITSAVALSSKFLNVFKKSDGLRRTVINISSLAALQPFKSWSLYCSTKAARDMIFKVLAEEEPDARVLNWAPGPVSTAMIARCIEDSADADVRETMAECEALSTDQTCVRLIFILEKDAYKSGDHIDYFDVKQQ